MLTATPAEVTEGAEPELVKKPKKPRAKLPEAKGKEGAKEAAPKAGAPKAAAASCLRLLRRSKQIVA